MEVVYSAIKPMNVIIACPHQGKNALHYGGRKAQRDLKKRPLSNVKVRQTDRFLSFLKVNHHAANAVFAAGLNAPWF